MLERSLTPRTRAVVVVHLHGVTADMAAIDAIALEPWSSRMEQRPLVSIDPASVPVTRRVLAGSFVLGSELAPLMFQSAELMERYVEELEAALSELSAG